MMKIVKCLDLTPIVPSGRKLLALSAKVILQLQLH
jgi:hypothetical protein